MTPIISQYHIKRAKEQVNALKANKDANLTLLT